MTEAQAILVTLVSYKILLILIGILSRNRNQDGADYFLGGRRMGPFVAALGASASSSSAWTLLGVSGAAFKWGLAALWIFPACVGGFVFNWVFLAPRLRRLSHETGALTVTELLAGTEESPWPRRIAWLGSLVVVIFLAVYVASQFQGAGKTFSEVFGLSPVTSVLLGAIIVVFYTMLGGFWAVSLTDSLQGLLMMLTATILPVAGWFAVGGFAGLAEGLEATNGLNLWQGAGPAAAIGFILGLLGIGLGYPGQPHVVNRFMAIETESGVRRGRQVAIVWSVVVFAGMLTLGLCGKVFYGSLTGSAAVDPETVFFLVTRKLFHPVFAGVMIAAVLSAIMSTADSQLLVVVSSLTHDLRPETGTGSELLKNSRLVVLLLSAVAVVAALYGPQQIFDFVLSAWNVLGATFGPALIVLAWKGRIQARYTFSAMLVGLLLSVCFNQFPATKGALERLLPFFLGLVIAWWGSVQAPARKSSSAG